MSVSARRFAVPFLIPALLAACARSPTGPSASLPLVHETATMRYHHESGDTIDVERQEAFNAWAVDRLDIVVPEKIDFFKYMSRDAMGRYTGNSNTNGFAEPQLWRLHTIWPFDNHEVVHVYTAMVGRPSDFFNEGIAVSFQTDPARGDYTARFNGERVHDACRNYLSAGTLPLPVSRYVTTAGFRGISNQTMSYRMAGSFVLFMTQRYGMPGVLQLFRGSDRDESADAIRARIRATLGVSLEDIEASWLAMLRD